MSNPRLSLVLLMLTALIALQASTVSGQRRVDQFILLKGDRVNGLDNGLVANQVSGAVAIRYGDRKKFHYFVNSDEDLDDLDDDDYNGNEFVDFDDEDNHNKNHYYADNDDDEIYNENNFDEGDDGYDDHDNDDNESVDSDDYDDLDDDEEGEKELMFDKDPCEKCRRLKLRQHMMELQQDNTLGSWKGAPVEISSTSRAANSRRRRRRRRRRNRRRTRKHRRRRRRRLRRSRRRQRTQQLRQRRRRLNSIRRKLRKRKASRGVRPQN